MRNFILCLVLLIVSTGCSTQRLGTNQFVVDKRWVRNSLRKDFLEARRIHRFSPILNENRVIVANSIDGVVAYDRRTAKVQWRIDLQDGVEGGAVLEEDVLYFGSGDGQFYAVNPGNGKTIWTYPLKAEGLARPLVKGGNVFVLAGNNVLHSLDAKSGKLNWIFNRRDASNLSIRGGSQPVLDEDTVYLGLSDGAFVALSRTSGNVKWEVNLNRNNRFKDIDAAPVLDGSFLFVPAYDGSLYCLQKSDGRIVWSVDEGGYDEVLVSGNTLFYSSTTNLLMALDKGSGKVIWKRKLNSLGTAPVAYKGTIAVGEMSGALKFFDARTGELVSMFEPGRGVTSKLAVDTSKSEVYFMSVDANVYALDARWKRYAKDWPWD